MHSMYTTAPRRLLLMLAALVFAQVSGLSPASAQTVTLRWKVKPGQALAYKTTMAQVKRSQMLPLPLYKMARGTTLPKKIKDQLKHQKAATSHEMISVLQARSKAKATVIDLKMVQTRIGPVGGSKKHAKSMKKFMQRMLGTVQLRGQFTPSGRLLSFYLQNRQKNLLGLMFELPQKPVKVGDSWSVGVNLLTIGSSIIPKQAAQINKVTLVSLKKTKGGDQVATLYYHIAESFRGMSPGFMGRGPKKFAMDIGFVGYGEFLVKAGRWRHFTGRMQLTTAGYMKRESQNQFELRPMASVPPKLLTLP